MENQDYVLRIEEMDCSEEVSLLQAELAPLVGGMSYLQFDILSRKLTIKEGKKRVELATILSAVKNIGMTASLWGQEKKNGSKKNLHTILILVSSVTLLAGVLLHFFLPREAIFFYVLTILIGGWFVFPKAWVSIKRFRPDIYLLMTIAVSGALLLGDFLEGASVTFLFSLSLLLESWTIERARQAIRKLMELAPNFVQIMNPNGSEETIIATQAKEGDVFFVKPGEKIPLDGEVLKGHSEVNQAPITGESLPIQKKKGDSVFAGTFNGNGGLEIKATATFDHSMLSKIIHLVADAHSKRSLSEQWVEKFSRYYTPVIIGLALLVVLIPPLLHLGTWHEWGYRSLVLLVIACPCSLVLSTPISIVSAITCAARHGILIKGGVFMELPALLKLVAFDKTGTLTQGELKVTKIVPIKILESEFLKIVGSIASKSDHPASKAIFRFIQSNSTEFMLNEDYQIIPGKGVLSRLNGVTYWLGSHLYLEEKGQETADIHHQIEVLSQSGNTVVVLGDEKNVLGFIALSDTPRKEAKSVIQTLREAGIKTVMLTGDGEGSAAYISELVGIDQFYAELLPHKKVEKVEELAKEMNYIAMVGDGINDAPAMASATIGIAMGIAGSDAAIESSDITLMSDDLTKIPWLINHSKKTIAIVKQNIVLSILIKVLFVGLTFSGYTSLWSAVMADMGISFLVVFNALRLLR